METKTQESFPKASLIIPNWNGALWLPGCLEALKGQSYQDFHVLLVDNGSTDESIELAKKHYPRIEIIVLKQNIGFAAAVNVGIRNSQSDYIALLNADTIPKPDWLLNLVRTMETSSPEVGSLASKMLDMSNPDIIENGGDILTWQGAAIKRGHGFSADEFNRLEDIFSPCAGAALYRRSYFETLGGFDECFFAYLEDVDLGLRGRLLGYCCLFVPTAEVIHKGHSSSLDQSMYVRLMTKNRLMLILKNIPFRLLLKNVFALLHGQFYFLICYKKPISSLIGYISFIPFIFHTFRERRSIMRRCKLSHIEIDALLMKKMESPSIWRSFLNWIRRKST